MESKVNKLINKWNTSSNEPALFVSAHWNPSSGAISDGSFVSSPTIMHVRHVNYPTLVFLALFLSACKMSKIIDFKPSKQKEKKQNTKHKKTKKKNQKDAISARCVLKARRRTVSRLRDGRWTATAGVVSGFPTSCWHQSQIVENACIPCR